MRTSIFNFALVVFSLLFCSGCMDDQNDQAEFDIERQVLESREQARLLASELADLRYNRENAGRLKAASRPEVGSLTSSLQEQVTALELKVKAAQLATDQAEEAFEAYKVAHPL